MTSLEIPTDPKNIPKPQFPPTKKPQYSYWGFIWKNSAATYSPAKRSTIGADGLNFSVRNGKRWDPIAIAT